MSTIDKLYMRIMTRPVKSDISFTEVNNFLLDLGFIRKPKGGGSHIVYKHILLEENLTIPSNRKHLIKIYVKQIQEAVYILERKKYDE